MNETAGDEHGERVERLTRGADLAPVADVLAARRDAILERWVEVVRRQPFITAGTSALWRTTCRT